MTDKRIHELHRERISYAKIEGMNSHKKELENIYHSSTYDKGMYENGQKWFESGLPFEEAPVELRENLNFRDGFKRGERLALIQKIQNEKSR